jgi:hypothetical protein
MYALRIGVALLEGDKNLVGLDLVSRPDTYLGDHARPTGGECVEHLHRFDHDQWVGAVDGLARLGVDLGDDGGERCDDGVG